MIDRTAGIMLVEDDRVDVMTVQRALKKNGVVNPLHVARTAFEALDMLEGEGESKISPLPELILLDLNLPGMNGIEFLEELHHSPTLKEIPVIILTSSDEPSDRAAAYRYDVADYIIKPHSFKEFQQAMATVFEHWSP